MVDTEEESALVGEKEILRGEENMNWDQEIEIEGEGKEEILLTLGEIQSLLMLHLNNEEMEEFAEELITISNAPSAGSMIS